MTPPTLAIVDYGMGNRRSVEKALERAGAQTIITADHAKIARADGIVVPGVGAFPRAMQNLQDLGLDDLLRERVAHGAPVLGICLGVQLFFESSSELGGAPGLGFIKGSVERLDAYGNKLPQIGWNEVSFTRPSELTAELPPCAAFYHVHSYAVRPADEADVLGTADYGTTFVSAIQHGNVYGVQFHPEKSSRAGLRLLANFATICAAAPATALRAR